MLDSQRIVSLDATVLNPPAANDWSRRASTYLRLIRATHDIGGMVGNGGPAAGEAALAASRVEQFARAVRAGTDTAEPGALRHLAWLGREIDGRITRVIQQGARERIYFARVPLPRIDEDAADLVKPTRQHDVPTTPDVCQDLLDLVRSDLQPETSAPQAPARAAASREELAAALVHRPKPRRAPSRQSL